MATLITLISNCNMYMLTRNDEQDNEKSEVLKISKFYEYIHDKATVGLPTRKVGAADKGSHSEA